MVYFLSLSTEIGPVQFLEVISLAVCLAPKVDLNMD